MVCTGVWVYVEGKRVKELPVRVVICVTGRVCTTLEVLVLRALDVTLELVSHMLRITCVAKGLHVSVTVRVITDVIGTTVV